MGLRANRCKIKARVVESFGYKLEALQGPHFFEAK